jgi:hypothetical protein
LIEKRSLFGSWFWWLESVNTMVSSESSLLVVSQGGREAEREKAMGKGETWLRFVGGKLLTF